MSFESIAEDVGALQYRRGEYNMHMHEVIPFMENCVMNSLNYSLIMVDNTLF
jgi:hypothetical protein